jgi:uncharacterized protein
MIVEKILGQLLTNVTLLSALSAMFLAQGFKIFYYWIFEHDLNFHHLFEVGGMPSSHAALVCCLSMMIGFRHGFDSSYFSIASVLSFIVMYDAIKVRPEEVGHSLLEVTTGGIFGTIISLISFFIFIK